MDNNNKINEIRSLIGNTPLLEITLKYKGHLCNVYAKAENMNLTGSIKDRMAYHILKSSIQKGLLKPGGMIIEATSGNTGISFSAIGKALGYKVCIFIPDWMSKERINLIRSFGSDVCLVSHDEGGFKGSIERAEQLAMKIENSFLPRQFSNQDNVETHFLTTGPEIHFQLLDNNIVPDAFIAGVGTGGTIMGAGKFLKTKYEKVKIHPLEPSNSPTLSTGHKVGKHRIQGISDEFIPSILKLNELDKVISIDDGDAIIMAQKLSNTLGLGVGISSGANLLGAIKIHEELGINSIVVTVFPDDNKKYLSTDLLKEEPVKQDFISNNIELISYKALKKTCKACNFNNENDYISSKN